MYLLFKIFSQPNPEIAAWVLAAIILIRELPFLRRFFVYLLMKLYRIFVQHNVEGL